MEDFDIQIELELPHENIVFEVKSDEFNFEKNFEDKLKKYSKEFQTIIIFNTYYQLLTKQCLNERFEMFLKNKINSYLETIKNTDFDCDLLVEELLQKSPL